ncbi:MAG: anti-sigma factor [Rubrivivax sp.]|nr:anti-sigma factor [Rubrivivax sp.]
MDYGRRELADALAAQYVAGTLRGRARARFEALLPGHPALQRAVADWQRRLLPLTGVLPGEPPPARVWQALERRLWPTPQPLPWWQRLGLWRALSGAALAGLVGMAALVGRPAPAEPPVVVVLQSTGGDPALSGGVVASFSADGQALVARPLTPVALQTDRVLELWWAPEKGKPSSLGLIRADGVTVLPRGRLPGGLKGSGIDHMAVSVEPPGGSPTGQPTGPVVFYGKL